MTACICTCKGQGNKFRSFMPICDSNESYYPQKCPCMINYKDSLYIDEMINGAAFVSLEKEDLKELKVSYGFKMVILKIIRKLNVVSYSRLSPFIY